MLDYNVPLGKLNRGMAVLDAARAVSGDKELTDEEVLKARVLGWCIEFVSQGGAYVVPRLVMTSFVLSFQMHPSLSCHILTFFVTIFHIIPRSFRHIFWLLMTSWTTR